MTEVAGMVPDGTDLRRFNHAGGEILLGRRTYVMGVVNVTPDSFSDGGQFEQPDHALAHAESLVEAGADIIDLGAESTRPGYRPVSADEEWRRLKPVLDRLRTRVQRPRCRQLLCLPVACLSSHAAPLA
jgi:dihydropteroate synthase